MQRKDKRGGSGTSPPPASVPTYVVIAYDVPEDRRRNRICKMLKNHGRHVQYSVFECELRRRDYLRLRERLATLINPAEDNIRFYFLDQGAVARIEQVGKPRMPLPDRTVQFVIL